MSDVAARPAPIPASGESLVLTNQERELIRLLRVINFWRFSRPRRLLLDWGGARLAVFDIQQMQ